MFLKLRGIVWNARRLVTMARMLRAASLNLAFRNYF